MTPTSVPSSHVSPSATPPPRRSKTHLWVIPVVLVLAPVAYLAVMVAAAMAFHAPIRVGRDVVLNGAPLSDVLLASSVGKDQQPGPLLRGEIVAASPVYCVVEASESVKQVRVRLTRVSDGTTAVDQQFSGSGGAHQLAHVGMAFSLPGQYRCSFQAAGVTREKTFEVAPVKALSAVVVASNVSDDGEPLARVEGSVQASKAPSCATVVDPSVRALRFQLLREGAAKPVVDRTETIPALDSPTWVAESLKLPGPGAYTCRFMANGVERTARFDAVESKRVVSAR